MSKKTTQTQHTEVKPTNPTWVEEPNKELTGDIDALKDVDPYSLVSGADPLMTQAAESAGQLGTPAAYGDADAIFRDVATSGAPKSLLDNLQAYMSPYTKDVVDTSLADYDFGAGQAKAQSDLDIRNSGAFGGSGAGIAKAMTADALTRGRGTLSAGLRDQAFTTGANLSLADAQQMQAARGQQLQAGGAMSDNASASQTNDRNNIVMQSQIGDILRQIDSQRRMAPISLLNTRAGLNGQMRYDLFNGSVTDGTTTTKTSDPMGTIGSLALGVGGLLAAPLTGGLSLGALGSLGGLGSIGAGIAGASGIANAARGLVTNMQARG